MGKSIEKARNLGPVTGAELREVGVPTHEVLCEIGWEEAMARLVARFPARANVNAATALIGAIEGVDWRSVSPRQKEGARRLLRHLRRNGGA